MIIDKHAHGRPAQFVLRTADASATAAYYGAVFGWEPGPDGVFSLAGRAVARIAQGAGGWHPYLTVSELDDVRAGAMAAGAGAVGDPQSIGAAGGLGADVTAPGGAVLGLWQAESGTAVEVMNEPGAVVWVEEKTHQQAADAAFLSELLGFELLGGEGPGVVRVLRGEGPPFAGVMQFDDRWAADEPPHWLLYFEVRDVEATVARSVEVGGSVWFAPFDTPLGRIAYLRDPVGHPFAVVQVSEQGRAMTGGPA